MKDSCFILDTSALLTLVEDEKGADRVEAVLKQAETLVPWVALLEAYYVTLQERGVEEADRRHAMLKELPASILWGMDEALVLAAARLKAAHRLSLADAMIAAFARQHDATLLHKDPEFEAVASEVRIESLPYKKSRPSR